MDQIKNGSIENSNDTVYSEGKQGVRLSAIDRNKSEKFSCTNGYVVASVMASQLGTTVDTATTDNKFVVRDVEYLTVGSNATEVTLSKTPIADSVKYIYKANKDNTQGEKFGVGTAASSDKFAISGNKITLPTDKFTENDVVIVVFDREVTSGKQIINSGDNYTGECYLVIDVLAEDPCSGVMYLAQHIMPKAKISGNFSISVGDNPAEHPMEAESMLDPCSLNKELSRWVIVE